MKKIIALTIALSAAAGANAAWDSGTDNGLNENGELLFFLFDEDAANKISGVQDLGIHYDTMRTQINNSGYTVSFALSNSVFGNFDSILTKNTLRWGVMGYSQGFFDPDYGMMITTNKLNPHAAAEGRAGLIDDALSSQPAYVGKINVNGDTTDYSVNNAVFGTDANNKYVGAPGTLGRSIKQSQPYDTTAGVTQDLAFYNLTDDFTATGFSAKFAGKWHLDLGAKTLTYNVQVAPPAVPVPAAAWLMGSALVGLAGVARRRNHK
jgi:hypothetical protein